MVGVRHFSIVVCRECRLDNDPGPIQIPGALATIWEWLDGEPVIPEQTAFIEPGDDLVAEARHSTSHPQPHTCHKYRRDDYTEL